TVYQFDSATTGTYRIKAQLLNVPSSGTGALPTYATSALMWNSASILYHSGDDLGQDINLQYGTVTGGPGFISGNVSAGANKGTKDGIPGMNVFLMDYNKKAIAYAITDINGDYSFNKVPVGNYSIYPESMSYYTTAGTATITNSSATISNVDFLRSEKHKTIMPNTTGITAIEKEVLNIYPNPAKDKVIINMNNPAETKSDLTIFNMNGQKLYQQSFNGNHTEVDLKGWAKGIYFIKIENENLHLIRKLTLE
ncbi:MAG: T9SS type A sorting domain-containing protein, partial [Flavipsychrobacter sp.]